jgi:hypothetical protein
MTKTKKSKGGSGIGGQLRGVFMLIAAIIFMPTTILLLLGMIPTIVVAVIDRSGKGTKSLTIGSMNLAGCSPFLIELWSNGHTAELAVSIVTNPLSMSVMWGASLVGYLINWAMSGIVATVMTKRGKVRIKDIKKKKARMIERWGIEVTGEIPLDPYGFPLETAEAETQTDTKA